MFKEKVTGTAKDLKLSLCSNCNCMSYTTLQLIDEKYKTFCGKCKEPKELNKTNKNFNKENHN